MPRRSLAERVSFSVVASSYQFDVLVASSEGFMAEERLAANLVVESISAVGCAWVEEDFAVTSPSSLRLRLTLCPASSSEVVYPDESDSSIGGGVAGRLRMDDLFVRFLNKEGAAAMAEDAETVSAIV